MTVKRDTWDKLNVIRDISNVWLVYTPAIFVGAGNWHQEEGFRKARSRRDGTTFSCFQTRDMFAELSVDHRHLAMLHNKAFDAFHGFT